GSVSAWSGKVAPWRTTMTKPPARSALATSLSSAAAEIGAASEIAANRPPANANAANLRRESTSMINLQLMREAVYPSTSGRRQPNRRANLLACREPNIDGLQCCPSQRSKLYMRASIVNPEAVLKVLGRICVGARSLEQINPGCRRRPSADTFGLLRGVGRHRNREHSERDRCQDQHFTFGVHFLLPLV